MLKMWFRCLLIMTSEFSAYQAQEVFTAQQCYLMTGVEEDKVQVVNDPLRKACLPPVDSQHGATIFVVDMPCYEQI